MTAPVPKAGSTRIGSAMIGILRPVPLAPALDESALVGFPAADALLGLDGHPTQIYLRALPDQVQPVVSVLPFTANPAQPEAVQVSLPSSILAARAAARRMSVLKPGSSR